VLGWGGDEEGKIIILSGINYIVIEDNAVN